MSLDQRNTYLLPDVCEVYLKSVNEANPFPDFGKIYGAPAKIKYSYISRRSKLGVFFKYDLNFMYPGLDEVDFYQFNIMLKDKFEIQIRKSDGNIYKLSSNIFPFKLSTKFQSGKGTTLTFKCQSPIKQSISWTAAQFQLFLASSDQLSSTSLLGSETIVP